ncbi:WLM domain-containing protein [Phycomyces nitens]|nr:WLM domain-containing protein [Phycomyces nitens]
MGSLPQQLKGVADMDKKLHERLTLAPKLHKKTINRTPNTVQDHKYTFHRITTLAEFPNSDQAHKLLERLRDDRGIRAIMKARQWSVGELTELTPFEATILGYNRNSGQLIAIRLRTDDLSGFRHYDSIRKVLLHELTHNVWSAHDDNFHALNRQLNKDVIALDWTAHGGRALDNESYYDPEEKETVSWEAGTYRLGGKSSTQELSQRELMAKAASGRLTKQEEQEMDNGCGSHQK